MAKKKKSSTGTFWKNIGMGMECLFRKLGIAIEWFGYLIWDIIHRVFELMFWVWGFALVTILIATVAFLFISLGIKALDQTKYSENMMEYFLPEVMEQAQAQSLPDILSEFTKTDE